MTNPFSLANLAPTWVEATAILKGDVAGHEFHGNQWSQGSGSAPRQSETRRFQSEGRWNADDLKSGASAAHNNPDLPTPRENQGDITGGASAHGTAASLISDAKDAASSLADRADALSNDADVSGTSDAAREHMALAEGHQEIADRLRNEAGYVGGHSSEDRAAMGDAAKLHEEAADAHRIAAEAHRGVSKEGEEYGGDDPDTASYDAAEASRRAAGE